MYFHLTYLFSFKLSISFNLSIFITLVYFDTLLYFIPLIYFPYIYFFISITLLYFPTPPPPTPHSISYLFDIPLFLDLLTILYQLSIFNSFYSWFSPLFLFSSTCFSKISKRYLKVSTYL